MAFKDYLTADGERMMAKAASGHQVQFTKLIMGSGYLPSSMSEKNVAEVIIPEKTLDIDSVTRSGNNLISIVSYFSNQGMTSGFYFREKAIYMSDGTEEVLAIYGNAGTTAEYIDVTSASVIEKKIRTVIEVANDEAVSITLHSALYAPGTITADQSTIEEFAASTAAIGLEIGQVVIVDYVPYTFVGPDSTDAKSYTSGSDKEEFDDSITTISSDGNTITTVYSKGAKVITEISDDGSTITESVYADGINISEKYQTVISSDGNTITESEVAV